MILNEKETDSFGAERNLHYICGANGLAAIYVTTADKDTMYYAFTDYQHNLLALTDAAGKPYERYSYDPWGNRRSATDWTQSDTLTHHIINRGYTLHEHLDEFGLINMNGRMYDPKLACFLSPDPVISDAGNWLDYNRYSYAWGNPLKYCDPTGMSETEGDHMEAHAKARHTPSDNNEPIMQWESQNGVIYKIYDCGDKYQFQANYNITCYGLGFMSKGGKTGKSEFDAGFSNSDMSSIDQAFAKFQSWNPTGYDYSGYTRQSGGNNKDWILQTVGTGLNAAGGLGTGLEKVKGTFRVTNSYGVSPKHYASGWKGNQYVKTYNSVKVGAKLVKGSFVLGAAVGVYDVIDARENKDGGVYGYNAQVATGEAVGGMVGSNIGAYIGGFLGGVSSFGLGTVPCAVIGGVVGGWIGSAVGGAIVKFTY